jgi:electron transport complex protein RnfE
VADAVGMGLGFMLALLIVSAFRELLGSGSLLGVSIFGPRYEPWVFMVMPPGGFLTLGLIFLFMGWRMDRDARRAKGEKA